MACPRGECDTQPDPRYGRSGGLRNSHGQHRAPAPAPPALAPPIAGAGCDGHPPAAGPRRPPGPRLSLTMAPLCRGAAPVSPGAAPAPTPRLGPISDVELPGPPLSRQRHRGAPQSRESKAPWNGGICSRRRPAARGTVGVVVGALCLRSGAGSQLWSHRPGRDPRGPWNQLRPRTPHRVSESTPSPRQSTPHPEHHSACLRAFSKHLLHPDRLGAVPTALQSLFSAQPLREQLPWYAAPASPDAALCCSLTSCRCHHRAEIGTGPSLPLMRMLEIAMSSPQSLLRAEQTKCPKPPIHHSLTHPLAHHPRGLFWTLSNS